MAYGRPANVRSHRRGGARRRPRATPWLGATLACLLVLVGLGVGYQQLLARACSGETTARVAAAQPMAQLLDRLAGTWMSTEPSTPDGTCARVVIEPRDSGEVAGLLALGWDDRAGERPDVWLPASTAWVQRAAVSDLAEPLLPDLLPSIARSPAVLAMPTPMAEELGWPDRFGDDDEARWASLMTTFDDADGWSRHDRAEWGPFRIGMTNPARSTAGLLALSAILDADEDGETTPEEMEQAFTLQQLIDPEVYHESTDQLLTALSESARGGIDAALRHVSVFPALEQEVFAYNRGNPTLPLAAVYPADATIEADHPYLILNADWVDADTRAAAEAFLTFLRDEPAQAELLQAGFRGPNRETHPDLNAGYGVSAELPALPRPVLVADSVTRTIDQWTALTRPSNVLLAVDVSGSMREEIPGTGDIRLDRARRAAAESVGLFPDEASVGFWEFSTALDGDLDYRSLVPLGPLSDVMEDNRLRREHLIEAIDGLTPQTDTGLYNTVAAAYDAVLANYSYNSANLVVVITDGEDDTGGRPGLNLDELLAHLRTAPSPDQQVRVVTVAFSEDADLDSLRQISELTGAASYYSEDGFDLVEQVRTAVFGGVSAP